MLGSNSRAEAIHCRRSSVDGSGRCLDATCRGTGLAVEKGLDAAFGSCSHVRLGPLVPGDKEQQG